MTFPRFLFSSLLLHVVLVGTLVFFGSAAQKTCPPISKTVLKASWVTVHIPPLKKNDHLFPPLKKGGQGGFLGDKRLVSEPPLLAKNMQENTVEGPSSQVRTRVLRRGGGGLVDALYLDSWKRKVETVGSLNYPAEAEKLGLSGSLKLRVLLNQDGKIEEATVLTSSGEAILDEAALKIVHLAAPFAPFPPAMRKEVNRLEIVRTWQFLGSREWVMM